MYQEAKLRAAHLVLRWTFGLLFIIVGLDSFTNLLVRWDAFLAPQIAAIVSATTFMQFFGIVQIVVGALALTPKTAKLGAWLVTLMLIAITLQTTFIGVYDIALRDLALTAAAFVLVKLEEAQS
jgi:uncharacterized membrane protein YphA (DoxX/SURF4 family)